VSIEKQCDEDKSVYIQGTDPTVTDSPEMLHKRMESVLSYHEKAGVWRRCYILATLLTLAAYGIVTSCPCGYNSWVVVHVLFFAIMYFFFNYINYHHMRRIKQNGMKILGLIEKNVK
jgi:hypothetical protein